MRTKTLLITAALSLAGVATSMAQVYSVNAVGYINLALKPGFNLVANQLNRTGAGGNSLNNVLPGLPPGSQVLKYSNALVNYVGPEVTDGVAWFTALGDPGTMTANPGEGIFINVDSATTVTLIGEVPQGATSVTLPSGFSMVASVVPQAIPLVAGSGFPQVDGNQYITHDAATQSFADPLINSGGAWFTAGGASVTVAPAVGQAFFYGNNEAPTVWNRTFSVN